MLKLFQTPIQENKKSTIHKCITMVDKFRSRRKKKDFHHDSIPMSWSFWSMKCRTCLDFEKVRMQIQTVEWVTPRRRPNILFSPLMAGSVVRMVSRDLAAMMDKMVVMKNKIIWMIIKAAPNRTKFVILMCAESLPESYLNPIKKFLSSFL